METPSVQKRAREDVIDESSIPSKKLCEGDGVRGLSGLESGEKDVSPTSAMVAVVDAPCLSSTTEIEDPQALLDEAFSGEETDRKDEEEALSETMKSLEEELGFSDDSADYVVSSSAAEDFTSSALANWNTDIWQVDGFEADNEILINGDAPCSSESSPAVSESPSSRNSSVQEEDGAEKLSTSFGGAVDLGFLAGASDDELGLPASPFSEREQSSEQDLSNDQFGLGDDSVASLQEAVSWALDDNDVVGVDSGIEEWMSGNLDFMMENPSENFGGSALMEAGNSLLEVGNLL